MRCILFILLLSVFFELSHSRVCPRTTLVNGRLKYRQRGRSVLYTCNVGYLLFGDRFSICLRGRWDRPPPKCVRPTCKKVNSPNNASIYPTHSGAVVYFDCKPEFQLKGPKSIYCNGSRWDSNPPTCIANNTKPLLSCDFESPDICGWSHDVNHDFDWRRMNFNTPSGSIGTGPSFDHTKGEGNAGYYMYIESSSRNENDTARLISPFFDKTTNDSCLEFYYHMYGATTGSLRVYRKLFNESWDLNPSQAFFSKHGEQGNRWIRSLHKFGPTSQDYQIIIEGVRGNGYVSDIAIDDVTIKENCNYEEELAIELSTSTSEEPASTSTPAPIGSCKNRCTYTINYGKIALPSHHLCTCNLDCIDFNTCCPDYFDHCILNFSPSIDYDDASNDFGPRDYTTDIVSHPVVPKSTTPYVKETTVKLIVTDEPVTEQITVPSKRRIPSTTSLPEITKMMFPSTMEEIVKTTGINAQSTRTQKNQRLTTIPTTNPPPSTTTEYVTSREMKKITAELIRTTTMSNTIPDLSPEPTPINDLDRVGQNNSQNDKQVIVDNKKGGSRSVVYFSITGVAIIIVLMLGIALLVRKPEFLLFLKFRRLKMSANGDSQSDVRFLTGDEVLFNFDEEQ